MDNQQVTLIIAGLYLGEGHFTLSRYERAKGKWQYNCEVGFTNQDPTFIEFVAKWFDEQKIAHFISMSTNDAYQIKVTRYEEINRLINILTPYLIGLKLANAQLLQRFVKRRMSNGKAQVPYDSTDSQIFEEKAKLKGSSETTRVPSIYVSRRSMHTYDDDIVRSHDESMS
jgi:hypothetical protein